MKYSIHVAWVVAVVVVSGCAAATPTSTVTETPIDTPVPATNAPAATVESKGETGCMVEEIGAVDESAVLTVGPAEDVPETTAKGEPMVITGVLVDAGCQPIAGGVLHVWQTDGDGVYGPSHGTNELQCCYLQGDVTADSEGRFKLITVRPGLYKGEASPPPAHIHVEGLGAAKGLETEIVFGDDPHLPANPIRMVVIDVAKSDEGVWTGVVVLVVGK